MMGAAGRLGGELDGRRCIRVRTTDRRCSPPPMALRFLGEGVAARHSPRRPWPSTSPMRAPPPELPCDRPDPPHAQHQLDERAEAW
ncbi:hypothetical protein SETIT_7G332500v2 [Setaria italica]|uniref:Uncharacterized protein n=1 Tax=Setaria italica TaxID=4555 RepID=A0A368S2Q5_SETIT|nr:hypothetical protein SETIT_7G332500v2 [Setaria italica]